MVMHEERGYSSVALLVNGMIRIQHTSIAVFQSILPRFPTITTSV